MVRLGEYASARTAFHQAIEDVRTMPSARKWQVHHWESEAWKELKKLAARAPAP